MCQCRHNGNFNCWTISWVMVRVTDDQIKYWNIFCDTWANISKMRRSLYQPEIEPLLTSEWEQPLIQKAVTSPRDSDPPPLSCTLSIKSHKQFWTCFLIDVEAISLRRTHARGIAFTGCLGRRHACLSLPECPFLTQGCTSRDVENTGWPLTPLIPIRCLTTAKPESIS